MKCIEDEIPFELPEGWAWVRFGTLTINRDSERKPVSSSSRKNVEKKYDYYGASGKIDKIDSYLFDEKLLLIGEDGANLVTRSKPIAFFAKGQYWVNNHAHCIDATDKRYLNYLCYFINAINLEPYVTGSAQPKMNQENMNSILISLPPFAEQLQILNQIDSFYDIIDSIENDQQDLLDVIGLTKSKILDLAIRGKLVPQNPDDEPASVLLERIRAEKEELIRQGKIKRDKKESIIFKGEDNSYYDEIPENWSITALNQLTHTLLLNDGDWILSENMNPQGEVKLIQLGSVGMMRYVDKGFKYLTEITFKELNCTQIYPGYMLINRIVSDKMCSCILPQIEGKLITTVDTCWVAPKEEWYSLKYLMYTLSSPTIQSLVMLNSAGTTRKRISKNNLINLPFAFPPLDEQHRIVEAIEATFAQLDAIAESLN